MFNYLLLLCFVFIMFMGYFEKMIYCYVIDGECFVDIFWKWWFKEYFFLFLSKQRGFLLRRNLVIGDVVLVFMENLYCNLWFCERVIDIFFDKK